MSLIQSLTIFLITLSPAILIVGIWLNYRQLLRDKLFEIDKLLDRQGTRGRYKDAFDSDSDDTPVHRAFNNSYGSRMYALPITAYCVVATMAAFLLFTKARLGIQWPVSATQVDALPAAALWGISGALLWGFYELLDRYRTADLAPAVLNFLWLRLIIAAFAGHLASTIVQASFAPLVAFAIGAFPLATIQRWVRSQGAGKLGFGAIQSEAPTLHLLQGMTEDKLSRLEEEGITSVQQLAYSDPFKLLLRTNFPWKVILDFMDQAILCVYVGEQVQRVRSCGVRGAIELVAVAVVEPVKPQALVAVSEALGQSTAATENLIRRLYEEPQVIFLWTLWGEAFSQDVVKSVPSMDAAATTPVSVRTTPG